MTNNLNERNDNLHNNENHLEEVGEVSELKRFSISLQQLKAQDVTNRYLVFPPTNIS